MSFLLISITFVDVKDEEVQTNSFETTKYASKYKHTTNSTKVEKYILFS